MHVAVDIDQTITAAPEFFAWLTRALRRDGHKVSVLSLRRGQEGAKADLARLGVEFDQLELLPLDFEGDIIQWKIDRAVALEVEVLIDDLPEIANRASKDIFVMIPRDLSMGFSSTLTSWPSILPPGTLDPSFG